jgi:hypothetical protein
MASAKNARSQPSLNRVAPDLCKAGDPVVTRENVVHLA